MDPLDATKLVVIKAINNNGLNFVSKGDGHYDEL